jgi:hypothetical protein
LGVLRELQNAELCEFVKAELSLETVFDLIELNRALESDLSTELDFIASKFDEFDDPFSTLKAKELEFWMIERIVSSGELKLKSEDSLYTFICAGLESNPDFFSLFEHVEFASLSTAHMKKFCELSCRWFDRFTVSIFERLRQRLIIPITPFASSLFYEDGILRFLTKQCGGNVHEKGEIEIGYSSLHPSSEWQHFARVVDLDDKAIHSVFISSNKPDSWLSYDFRSRRVYPTKYYIRSRNYHTHHMRSWVVEGSNNRDGNQWIELDRRDDIDDLSRANGEVTFPIAHSDWFRWIRLRQTGKTSANSDYLIVSAFDIFGFMSDRSAR